jgi:hypothetical protein
MQPQIVSGNIEGWHNRDLQATRDRLIQGKTYMDLSTVCIVPTRGMIPAKAVQSWLGMMTPMNQKFIRIFTLGMEVADAYNETVASILASPELSTWKYILTLEEDNLPPPDGLINLYKGMDKFDVIGGLYYTKGPGGQPMIYGDPAVMPKNFIPQPPPQTEGLVPANGLGMGFTLFKLDIFKDPDLPRPWFKTLQSYQPGVGAECYTQDLYFFQRAAGRGYRFACDTRVKVGHYDIQEDMVW